MSQNDSWKDETIDVPAYVDGNPTTAIVRVEDLNNAFYVAQDALADRAKEELLQDPDLTEYLKLHDTHILWMIYDTLENLGGVAGLRLFSKESETFGDTTLAAILEKLKALLEEFDKAFHSEKMENFYLTCREIFRNGKKKADPADPLHHGPDAG